MKYVSITLAAITFLLLLSLLFGTHGAFKLWELQKQIKVEIGRNQKLVQRNEKMHLEIIELQQKKQALESRAREQLGFIKEGETFYQIIPAK